MEDHHIFDSSVQFFEVINKHKQFSINNKMDIDKLWEKTVNIFLEFNQNVS